MTHAIRIYSVSDRGCNVCHVREGVRLMDFNATLIAICRDCRNLLRTLLGSEEEPAIVHEELFKVDITGAPTSFLLLMLTDVTTRVRHMTGKSEAAAINALRDEIDRRIPVPGRRS